MVFNSSTDKSDQIGLTSNPLVKNPYFSTFETKGSPAPPQTSVRITDNGNTRVTDNFSIRIIDE